MDEQVWCDLDLQLPTAAFWPALADCCSASFLAGDDTATCFGEMSITGLATDAAEDMVLDLDTSCFAAGEHQDPLLTMQHDEQQTYSSSSSLSSSKRSLSIDSAGTSSPFAGDDDDAAIMRAMMAVLSSASPSSSSESSTVMYPRRGENDRITSSLLAVTPPDDSQRPEQDSRAAPGGNNNSSQVYHMMSERKRREKLNDRFQTLRSLLPPCSKKDKTTVLMNAASYLKKLESEVSELEERNGKLVRHVPGSGAASRAAAHRRRAKVQISSAADQVTKNLTVMVMVECDIVDLMLHILERLRWMPGLSVLSVDADTYSPQVLLKAIASIKLQITDGDCWNEASFHEAINKVVDDATSITIHKMFT